MNSLVAGTSFITAARSASVAALLLCGTQAFPATAAHAESVDTTGATSCRVSGFVYDTDPKGTNVRRAPGVNAPIIGHLPPLGFPDKDSRDGPLVGVEFTIAGSKDGWLLIKERQKPPVIHLDPAYAAAGLGWISARLAGTQLGAWTLRAAPRHDAAILGQMQGDWGGPDSVKVMAIHGCDGGYIDVTVKPLSGPVLRGWSWLPCASQLTTCDRADEQLDR
jgi:hypothetical protein